MYFFLQLQQVMKMMVITSTPLRELFWRFWHKFNKVAFTTFVFLWCNTQRSWLGYIQFNAWNWVYKCIGRWILLKWITQGEVLLIKLKKERVVEPDISLDIMMDAEAIEEERKSQFKNICIYSAIFSLGCYSMWWTII